MTVVQVLKPRAPTMISTATFIRDHLQTTKGDYCYHVWKLFSAYLTNIQFETPPKYDSFKRYWWILSNLGLIEPIGPPQKGKRGLPIQLYRIKPGMAESPKWRNPQAELDILRGRLWLDPATKRKIPVTRLGARRYRRRVLKLPPRKPGRPRKVKPPPGLVPTPSARLTAEEQNRIWRVAQAYLRENRYSITREEFESVFPNWPSYLEELDPATKEPVYETFRQKAGFIIHEAVEIEVVSLIKGVIYDPQKAPEPVRERAHEKAVDMEKKWLRRK